MRNVVGAAVLVGGALFGLAAVIVGAATPTARAFPMDQVARGEEVWNAHCTRCHGPESDNPESPPLLNPGALKNYSTAAALFEYVQGSMPQDEPASLSNEQYWDVLAFLIDRQGIPSGDAPLGPDNARGFQIRTP